MVKRPELGKRKRVTQPPSEAADQPEQPDEVPDTQASDPGDTATQAIQPEDTEELKEATQDSQSHGRYKKKRLVRMTDAQEDEIAEWPKNHPEMYNKGKSTGTWTGRRLFGPPRPGPWAWKVSCTYPYTITLSLVFAIM